MRGPALAVVGSDGRLERSTSAFSSVDDAEALLDEGSPELERVLRGEAASAVLTAGGVTAAVEAVVDAAGGRHALVTLNVAPEERDAAGPANPLLEEDLDLSPAVVFLKDMHGRYLRVNAMHGKLIGGGEEQLLGRADSELSANLTVDGPRMREHETGLDEPLQLEYIVPALERRPALSVLRFAVHDRQGDAIAVCGVAMPLSQADVARAEAERLIDIERLAWLDPGQARAELLDDWGLVTGQSISVERDTDHDEPAGEVAPVARGPATSQEAEDARLRGEQARVDAEQARAESQHLRGELEVARTEVEQARAAARRAHEEAEAARTSAQAARGEAGQALVKIEQLQAESLQLSRRLEEADAQVHDWRQQAEQAEIEAAQTRARADQADAEARTVRARVEEAEARAHAVEADARRAKERAAELEKASRRAIDTIEQLKSGERQAHLESERLEGAARQLRVQLDELEGVSSRARASAQDADERARHWRTQAEQAQAELEALRSQACDGRSVDDALAVSERLAAVEAERDAAAAAAAELREAVAAEAARTDELRRTLAEAQERVATLTGELEAARARHAAELSAASDRHAAELSAASERWEAQLQAARGRQQAELEAAVARQEAEVERLRRELGDERERAAAQAALASRLEQEQMERHAAAEAVALAGGVEPAHTGDARGALDGRRPSWSPGAQRALAASLGDVRDPRAGLGGAAAIIGAHGGWDVVAAWLPGPRGTLRCVASWSNEPHRQLERLAVRTAPPTRSSPLGAALYAREPVWVTGSRAASEVRDAHTGLPLGAADAIGTALVLPLRHGVARTGLLELLAEEAVDRDEDVVRALEAVGLQLGQFVALTGARGRRP